MMLEVLSLAAVDSAKQVFGGADTVSFTPVPPDVIWLNAFGTIGAILVAAMGLLSSMFNHRKIQEIHVLVNSQTQLLRERVLFLEKQASKAEGVEEGRQNESSSQ